MFRNCKSLQEIPDISKWKTSNIKDMSRLFQDCIKIQKIPDISKWDLSNTISISSMFYNCNNLLLVPDISKWNLTNCWVSVFYLWIAHLYYKYQNISIRT